MRYWTIGFLIVVTSLGCSRAEEARQKAVAANLKQIELALRNYHETHQPEPWEISPVIGNDADYYNAAPEQESQPDGKFEAGTEVEVIEEVGSYVLVQSKTGSKVYVAADAVKQHGSATMDLSEVVEGGNQFALDLYHELRSSEGNLFFSPGSISTALAMTYAGAASETKSEMANTLHFKMSNERLHEAMKTLQEFWRLPVEGDGIRLNLANRLWGQDGQAFLPEFLTITREQYGAELARLNFSRSDDARSTINSWVEDQTANKITDLIPAGVLSSDTKLVLTNAVYFHGTWTDPFKKTFTEDEDFHVTATETIKVPMMHRLGDFRYKAIDELQVLELPYGDGSLSMVVVLPNAIDGLSKLESDLTLENLRRWTASIEEEVDVKVYLPKFKTTSQFEMSDALKSMGMNSVFDPESADFSGMTGDDDLFISAVIHKAFVDVNEEGTEAAAATGIVLGVTSAAIEPSEPPVFRADHPFLFLIRDNRTEAIMFIGRITNPTT